MYQSYKVTFCGMSREFGSLLPALEFRQQILGTGAHVDFVDVYGRSTPSGPWEWFDAEKFLRGMERLLAPAE